MRDGDANELLAFEHVRVLSVMHGALRCLVAGKRVWLPRQHIKGALWCRGDSGRLMVRRWVAVDRKLTLPAPAVMRLVCQPVSAASRTRRSRRLGRIPHD
jgi:hypothetical protein